VRAGVTPAGAKVVVIEAKLDRRTIGRTIGDVRSWTIEAARSEANQMRVQIDGGEDPRELERRQKEAKAAHAMAESVRAVLVSEAWGLYLEDRRPRWGALHYRDHLAKAKAGGEASTRGTRGKGQTVHGPLYPLLGMKLSDLTPSAITAWANKESATRPTATRLAWRLLRGFLNWWAGNPRFPNLGPAKNPARTRAVRRAVGKPKVKQDCLQREQLPAWFAAVRQLPNTLHAVYLQTLLLTGARPGEILAIRWEDVNSKWKGLTIRDKVEGTREIPLTPYVASLLASLPRINEWVFASASKAAEEISTTMSTPHKAHERASTVAGIEGLTLHGLHRSFKSLTEWLEVPAGVVAQLMGHKPSATAEKHYTVRPLDLLRVHHERIETWLLEQAQLPFEAEDAHAPPAPRPMPKASPLRRIS